MTEQVDLSRGLRPRGRTNRLVVERYQTTVGKRVERTALMTEARFAFAGTGSYRVKLADDKVLIDGALATPWRTMIVGDLGTVTSSTLVDDLAPRSKVQNTDWVHPGKAFWSWLAGGREAGQSLKIQKGYVDFAAAHGWPYVVVDAGWNLDPNWDPDPTWEQTSWLPGLVQQRERPCLLG